MVEKSFLTQNTENRSVNDFNELEPPSNPFRDKYLELIESKNEESQINVLYRFFRIIREGDNDSDFEDDGKGVS